MMRFLGCIAIIILLVSGCAHLPEISPSTEGAQAHMGKACRQIFPTGNWQFLHTIEATPPNGQTQTMLGLSQLFSNRNTAHCVMMTLEGFVLFEAQYDGQVHIQRAVPPFDMPGFAQGLFDDLLLIFFVPQEPPMSTGNLEDGTPVCRYQLPEKQTQDILLYDKHHWELHRYNQKNKVIRTVKPGADAELSPQGFPSRIVLTAPGLTGYRLTLTLVEAESFEVMQR